MRLFQRINLSLYFVLLVWVGMPQVSIGAKVPDIEFHSIFNANYSKAKLSDFSGRLVILDFWHINCAVCIQQFPKIEKLQEKFGSRILILPVGFQVKNARKTIQQFIEKRKNGQNEIRLATAIEEYEPSLDKSFLFELFPFQSMPHLVWIDGDGILRALTDHTALTEGNILRILKSKREGLPNRKKLHSLSYSESFLLKGDNESDKVNWIYGSAFSHFNDTLNYLPRLRDNLDLNQDRNVWVVRNINQPIFYSYRLAYADKLPELLSDIYNKRIIFESKRKVEYKDWSDINDMDNWQFHEFALKNLFSYELILPRGYSKEELLDYVIQDFDRYFRFKSKIELRRVECLVLKRCGVHVDLMSRSGNQLLFESENADTIKIDGYPISNLVKKINSQLKSNIVLDETGINGNINIQLNAVQKGNIDSYKRALAPLGLELVVAERTLPMLVIKEY